MNLIYRIIMLSFTLLVSGFWPNTISLAATNDEPPSIVASIAPFYDLVAGVMNGVGTAQLLVKIGASPHDYSLKPSDIEMLKAADVIFWGGPGLESFLIKPLNAVDLKDSAQVVQLDKTPKLLLLPLRQSPNWEPHQHGHGIESAYHQDSDHNHKHTEEQPDMHFWLDPDNAMLLIDIIVKKLSIADAKHEAIYQKNGTTLKQQLKKLDTKLKTKLKNIRDVPFIVFHDGYQYFEHHYGLNGVGAITLHPEVPPSARRLATIREIIQKTHAHCVFSEPQFQPKLVQSILKDTNARSGQLDPLGSISEDNKNGYFILLENLANSLVQCLQ